MSLNVCVPVKILISKSKLEEEDEEELAINFQIGFVFELQEQISNEISFPYETEDWYTLISANRPKVIRDNFGNLESLEFKDVLICIPFDVQLEDINGNDIAEIVNMVDTSFDNYIAEGGHPDYRVNRNGEVKFILSNDPNIFCNMQNYYIYSYDNYKPSEAMKMDPLVQAHRMATGEVPKRKPPVGKYHVPQLEGRVRLTPSLKLRDRERARPRTRPGTAVPASARSKIMTYRSPEIKNERIGHGLGKRGKRKGKLLADEDDYYFGFGIRKPKRKSPYLQKMRLYD